MSENTVQPEKEVEKAPGTESETAGAAEKDVFKQLQDDLAEAKDKYLRLYAEFDNFRRRTAKEKIELIQSAGETLINQLLPVIDDFERAGKLLDRNDKGLEGVFLIENKFRKILDASGVKAMETSPGDEFNPDLHDAITQVPTSDAKLKGRIVDIVERGYLLNDKVIRHAKVVIGN